MKIKEDCDHGSEDERAHCLWSEKEEVPPKRLRGLGSSDGSVRLTFPIAVLGITDFGNNWGRGLGIASVGREAQVLASKSAFSFPGRPACPGTHWKLKVVLLEREEARDQTFHRDSGMR